MIVDLALVLAKTTGPYAGRLLKKIGKEKFDKFLVTYTKVFQPYLDATYRSCAEVTLLLNQEAKVNLLDIYVNVRLVHSSQQTFPDENVLKNLKHGGHRFTITGLAGSGKSMLMRWIAINLISEIDRHQKIPLFIEVRDLDFDSLSRENFARVLFSYVSGDRDEQTFSRFVLGLEEGCFILILDGVDEAPPEQLRVFISALKKFFAAYRAVDALISTRPGTQTEAIPGFLNYKIDEFNLQDAITMLEKAPYNAQRKEKFVKELSDGLYERHKSFLENPLLLTIMLITFDDAARIPEDLAEFYSEAFDALFSRHDWSKGVFIREKVSCLEKAEFEILFQYLCYLTYFNSVYSFSRSEILRFVTAASEKSGIAVDPEKYLYDCQMTLCLIVEDGNKFAFVHRSFQEYFTAKLISGYSGPSLETLIENVVKRFNTDSTYLILVQLNREAVIRSWALQEARAILERYRDAIDREKFGVSEQLGISQVGFRLKDGVVQSLTGSFGAKHARLRAVLKANLERGSIIGIKLGSTIYPDGEFKRLSDSQQKAIRKLTVSNDGRVNLSLSVKGNEVVEAVSDLIRRGALAHLEEIIQDFENYLEKRDDIADILQIVSLVKQ